MQGGILPLGNLLQRIRDLDIILGEVGSARTTTFGLVGASLCGLEFALSERRPRRNGHSLVPAHGDDFSLDVSESGVPSTLVYGERTETVGPSVVVGLDDNPGGGVGDTEVQDLAGGDEVVEAVHDFFHGGGEVPPVDVEEVDVIGLELLETALDGDAHALDGISDEVGLEGFGVTVGGAETGGVFGGDPKKG